MNNIIDNKLDDYYIENEVYNVLDDDLNLEELGLEYNSLYINDKLSHNRFDFNYCIFSINSYKSFF